MNEINRLNENGYRALTNLARSEPSLFTEADPDRLRNTMTEEAGDEDVWEHERPLTLRVSLEPLNWVGEGGPVTDARYARIVRQALPDLSLSDASDDLFWASINCFALARYVPIRWSTSNTRNTKPTNFVNDHWLKFGSQGRRANAAARLWWQGELSQRVSAHSKHSAAELLEAMSGNVSLYHQTLSRPYLMANPRMTAAIYETALDGNDHLFQTTPASDLFKSLNLSAGAIALDLMDDEELRAVVREAVPPKKP